MRDECWLGKCFILFVWVYIMYLNNRWIKVFMFFTCAFCLLFLFASHAVSEWMQNQTGRTAERRLIAAFWQGSSLTGLKVPYYSAFQIFYGTDQVAVKHHCKSNDYLTNNNKTVYSFSWKHRILAPCQTDACCAFVTFGRRRPSSDIRTACSHDCVFYHTLSGKWRKQK